jgi:hypothetical protein
MLSNKNAMKNITQPYPTAFQVRIVSNKKETSRLFSFSHWGGKNKALAAARSWRDQVKVIMKKRVRRLTKVPSHNKSTGVLGVSRTHRYGGEKQCSLKEKTVQIAGLHIQP